MSVLLDIVSIVLPVFLVIFLGFGLKRTRLVDASFLFQLNRLVYYLGLPSLLLYKIASADFSQSFNGALVLGFALSVSVGFMIAYGFTSLRRYPPAVRGAFAQGAFRGNLAYVGLAMVFNAYGESGLASAGILLGFIVPLMSVLAVIGLLLPHQESGDRLKLGHMVREIAYNPLIIACFMGIVWSVLKLPIPQVVDSALHIITGMALPLALISIGASFSLTKLRGDMGKTFLATAMKLIMLPVVTTIILFFLEVKGQDLAIGVLLAGTPTATAAFIMAQQMKGDAELSGAIIMLSTLFSPISFGVALFLLKTYGV